jgi:hypothetical protein
VFFQLLSDKIRNYKHLEPSNFMKKFTINCDFGGQMSPFTIFIGKPEHAHHPLHFQADWLSKARGGMIPGEVMEAVSQLQELAEKNGVSLEELCVYALGSDAQQAELEKAAASSIDSQEAEPNNEEESADESDEEIHEKHEVDDHHEHDVRESQEDMASEGGHIEEDASFEDEAEKK